MAQVAKINIKQTSSGVPKNYKKEVGTKWSPKMKRSFEQAKNGEFYVRNMDDINNFCTEEDNDGDSYEEIVANLKQAAKDLILIREGKLETRPLIDFLN
ncbi:MAG: hypothetical protein FWH18_08900 [Marinilabiliaceae bacterium]|nr:hypothetical protein [Marinilabiliaceae bacterium]